MHLYKMIHIPIIGKRIIKRFFLGIENGELYSKTIREYFEFYHSVKVDEYSYGCFDEEFNFADAGSVEIGRYCSFGGDCHYYGANHPYWSASTSPIFYKKNFGYNVIDVPRYKIIFGNDVWCGHGVSFTCSCSRVGNGAVIAAGAVVTKDIPPYAIVGGNPAKIIKYRFDNETIDLLEKSKWYDLNPEQVMKFYSKFNNAHDFAMNIIEWKNTFVD